MKSVQHGDSMGYSTDFVLRVNEIYHDEEKLDYETHHSILFRDEQPEWQKLGMNYIAGNNRKVALLDIGSGTGFVPMQIARYLKKDDLFVCSDISGNILDVCKNNVSALGAECDFEFLKLDGKTFNLESNRFDYITMNAVLHHIPDYSSFFKEVDRMLKPGGIIIIGYEPNRSFYQNLFLRSNYKIFSAIFNPMPFVLSILRRISLDEIAFLTLGKFSNRIKTYKRIIDNVNRRLIDEKQIEDPLSSNRIIEIMDIHSPGAGCGNQERSGIDVNEILRMHLCGYELIYFDTHHYVGDVSNVNFLMKRYDSFLKNKYPSLGSTLFTALLKR
jgi:ubiquinone/menaquinone biosynthesis C-methylase UbiE